MARKTGKAVLIKRTATPATILLQTECTLNVTRDAVETTTKDETYATFVAGDHPTWTVDGTLNYDAAEATNDGPWADIDAGTEQDIQVAVDTETYTGKAFCTAWTVEGSDGGVQTLTFSYQGTGALTKA